MALRGDDAGDQRKASEVLLFRSADRAVGEGHGVVL